MDSSSLISLHGANQEWLVSISTAWAKVYFTNFVLFLNSVFLSKAVCELFADFVE